jgi:hypothetical protein
MDRGDLVNFLNKLRAHRNSEEGFGDVSGVLQVGALDNIHTGP